MEDKLWCTKCFYDPCVCEKQHVPMLSTDKVIMCAECKTIIIDLICERIESFKQQRKKDRFVNSDKLKIRANELRRLLKLIESI